MGSRRHPELGLVRPARPGDGERIGPNLRPEDAGEVLASMPGYETVSAALEAWIADEDPVWVWVRQGRVDSIGGVQDTGDKTGHAWLLSTAEGLEPAHGFHRLALECLMAVEGRYGLLTASSGRDLDVHHRWLRRLGFTPFDEDPNFIYFYRRR